MNRFIWVILICVVLMIVALFTPSFSFAAPIIEVASFPSTINAGQEFEVGYRAEGLDLNVNYNIKGLGGTNFTEVDTWNNQWLQQNASWDSMPQFSSEATGSPSGTFKVRFAPDTKSGSKDLKIRIKKSGSSEGNIDSNIVVVNVVALTPAPSPQPTAKHSPTNTPLKTPDPTVAPTVMPTKKPVPIKTTNPTPEVLSAEINTESDTPNPSDPPSGDFSAETNKFPVFAVVIIVIGLGLVGFAVFLSYKQNKAAEVESLVQ